MLKYQPCTAFALLLFLRQNLFNIWHHAALFALISAKNKFVLCNSLRQICIRLWQGIIIDPKLWNLMNKLTFSWHLLCLEIFFKKVLKTTLWIGWINIIIRKHSSRMRTARLSTVFRGILGPISKVGGGGTHPLDIPPRHTQGCH